MSDGPLSPPPRNTSGTFDSAPARADHAVGSSTLYRLCEEMIALRETNNRQHKLFEQALTKARDAMQANFNEFAGNTQKAYQHLRHELHGEKRVSLNLLTELLEIDTDLRHLVASRPAASDPEGLARWADSVEVEARKVHASLERHGIRTYNADIGSVYNPAIHERVGSRRAEGMDPLRVAEQIEPGYASEQPDFKLRRPKVIISE